MSKAQEFSSGGHVSWLAFDIVSPAGRGRPNAAAGPAFSRAGRAFSPGKPGPVKSAPRRLGLSWGRTTPAHICRHRGAQAVPCRSISLASAAALPSFSRGRSLNSQARCPPFRAATAADRPAQAAIWGMETGLAATRQSKQHALVRSRRWPMNCRRSVKVPSTSTRRCNDRRGVLSAHARLHARREVGQTRSMPQSHPAYGPVNLDTAANVAAELHRELSEAHGWRSGAG